MKQKYTGFKRAAVCFFALLAVCLAGTALGEENFTLQCPGKDGRLLTQAGSVQVKSQIDGWISAAVYDSGGRLVQVERCAKTQDGYTFHLPGGIEDGTLKLFCWEGEKSIRPLCQSELYWVDTSVAVPGKKYSAVYLSSRWYRQDGQDGQLGTLDVLKRFMATGEKWGYISDAGQISSITNMGLTFQNAVNINVGDTPQTKAVLFDGTIAQAPWMSWGAKWSCVNNPFYVEAVETELRQSVENGVSEIQFDDWASNVACMNWGGCFCTYCMDGFREYLKEHLSEAQLEEYQISGIDSFDYKEYISETYPEVRTNEQYLQKRASIPLNEMFSSFQTESTRSFHKKEKAYLEENGVTYSHNVTNFGNSCTNPSTILCYDIFDAGLGETNTSALSPQAILTSGKINEALGKQYIYSPLPTEDNGDVIQTAIALCYATGQQILVPWDVWLEGDTRYFGTVEEYGKLFHFVRQYSWLFDDHKEKAKVGVIVNLDEVELTVLQQKCMDLAKEGISFRLLVSRRGEPSFSITQEDLKDLQVLIPLSDVEGLKEEEQQMIAASGLPMVEKIDRESYCQVEVEEDDVLLAVRYGVGQVVHLINESPYPMEQISLKVKNQKDGPVTYYSPGYDPVDLTPQRDGEWLSVTVPHLEKWGIVYIGEQEQFRTQSGWSAVNIGTWSAPSDTVQGFEIQTHGEGLGITTEGDTTGTQDRVGMIYKQTQAKPFESYAVQAIVEQTQAGAGVMLRQNPASNTRFMAAYLMDGYLNLSTREEENGAVKTKKIAPLSAPAFIKLEYDASTGWTRCYYGEDEEHTQSVLVSAGMKLDRPIAGMFATGAVSGKKTSNFSMPQITVWETEQAPEAFIAQAEKSEIEEGEKTKIDASCRMTDGSVIEDLNLHFTSSNEEILQVNRYGVVLGKKAGSAVVTVRATFGGVSVSAQVPITVTPWDPTVIQEDFEQGVSKEWQIRGESSQGGYYQVTQDEETKSRVLEIYDTVTENDLSLFQSMEAWDEVLTAQLDFKTKVDATGRAGAIVFYTYDAVGQFATSLLTSKDRFYTISDGETVTLCPLEQGKWYHISLKIDVEENLQTITIAAEDGQPYTWTGAFRNQVGNISGISIGGNVDAYGTKSFWDNITVLRQKKS